MFFMEYHPFKFWNPLWNDWPSRSDIGIAVCGIFPATFALVLFVNLMLMSAFRIRWTVTICGCFISNYLGIGHIQYKIVHFQCHGLLLAFHPRYSFNLIFVPWKGNTSFSANRKKPQVDRKIWNLKTNKPPPPQKKQANIEVIFPPKLEAAPLDLRNE